MTPLKDTLVILVLGLSVGLCYSQTLTHSFVWDTVHMLNNQHLQAFSWDNTVWVFTHWILGNWIPVSLLSHTLDFVLFGWSPAGHHLMSLIIHFMNSMLVYWLVKRLVSMRVQSAEQVFLIAALSALVFVIHPLRVEAVAWVAARNRVLYSLFTLLSILAYVAYATSNEFKYRRRTYILSLVSFVLALLSGSMAVTLPAVLVILDFYPIARVHLGIRDVGRTLTRVLWDKIPYFVLTVAVIVMTLVAHSVARTDLLDQTQQIQNAIHNVGFYLVKFVAPINLSPFYPFESVEAIGAPGYWLPALSAIGLISIVVIYLAWRGYLLPLCCWMLYLITLSPQSGAIHIGSAASADRYAYLTSLPWIVLLSAGIVTAYLKFTRFRAVIFSLTLFALLSLALLTHAQVNIWASPVSLWSRVLQLYPNAALAHRNISTAYVAMGEYDLALQHLESISNQGWQVDKEIAQALSLANRTDESIHVYEKMLESDRYTESERVFFAEEVERLKGELQKWPE